MKIRLGERLGVYGAVYVELRDFLVLLSKEERAGYESIKPKDYQKWETPKEPFWYRLHPQFRLFVKGFHGNRWNSVDDKSTYMVGIDLETFPGSYTWWGKATTKSDVYLSSSGGYTPPNRWVVITTKPIDSPFMLSFLLDQFESLNFLHLLSDAEARHKVKEILQGRYIRVPELTEKHAPALDALPDKIDTLLRAQELKQRSTRVTIE